MTCACQRLSDWVQQLENNVVFRIRPYLNEVCKAEHPNGLGELFSHHPWTIIVNARIVPSRKNLNELDLILQQFDSATVVASQQLAHDQYGRCVVAAVPTKELPIPCSNQTIEQLEIENGKDNDILMESIGYPHDLVRFNQAYFNENLNALIADDRFTESREGLFVATDATIDSNVVIKTVSGPVVVDAGATVGPFSYLEGPVYVGPKCKVLEHASIKDCVCLTDTVKAGGEIEASVIEPYSNKQHHGFLGHSYLGSWINIGAGTCNSDLKNTYGKVNVRYGREKVGTEMQFVGCFIGDYSKTAINTSIFTGKTIGVCSMLYGFVAENVPSFVNYAASFSQKTCVPADVMIRTQQRMFSRRNISPRACDIELINRMFEHTKRERASMTDSMEPPNF